MSGRVSENDGIDDDCRPQVSAQAKGTIAGAVYTFRSQQHDIFIGRDVDRAAILFNSSRVAQGLPP